MASQTSGMEWIVDTNKTDSWIHVNPSAETGSKRLEISVDPATSESDKPNGTLVISGSNGSTISISVTRCKKCAASTSVKYGYVESAYTNCDDSNNKSAKVPYTSTTINTDCTSSTTVSSTTVYFDELDGKNCNTKRTQIIEISGQTVAKGTQEGDCKDPDCYGDCLCTPEYAQKGSATATCEEQDIEIIYEITGFTNCDNPKCNERIGETASTSIEIGCNSGSSRNVTGTTSYGDWSVTQEGSCQCGQCDCDCNFSNFQTYPIPAQPTSRVKVLTYQYIAGTKGDMEVCHGAAWYVDTENIIHSMAEDDWIIESSKTGNDVYMSIYVPSSKIEPNTSTTENTDTLHVKSYRCTDSKYKGKTGYTSVPSTAVCDTTALTITQEGKEVPIHTCDCSVYQFICTTIPYNGGSHIKVGEVIKADAECILSEEMIGAGVEWMSNFSVSWTGNNGTIYADVQENPSTSMRYHGWTYTIQNSNGDVTECSSPIDQEQGGQEGKPAEPDFSTKIDVGVHSDYGTRMCRYDTNIDTNYISVNRGGLDIDIAGNFTGDAYIKFYPDADNRTQLAREEDRMKYIIWQTGDTISRIEGNSWDEVDSSKFETFGEVGYGGPQSTIVLNSGGRIVVEFWIQQHC